MNLSNTLAVIKYALVKHKTNQTSGTISPLLIAGFAFIVVVVAGYLIYVHVYPSNKYLTPPLNSSKTTTQTNSSNSYQVLKPATVPPKVAECSETLSYASDGDPSPIQCSNGYLNALDWQAMAALEPTVMKLGYSPSQSQVEAAICADGNAADADSSAAISAPLETNAYQISALYYGWNFSIDPTSLLDGGC